MKKQILCLVLLFGTCLTMGQSLADLEKQLQETPSAEEKLTLLVQLGEGYLRESPDKAISYSKQAYQQALTLNRKGIAARAAYLVAQGYERQRDERNQEVWLKSTLAHAKEAGDLDLIIQSVDRRSRLATRDRNYRRAYEINQEAFEFFSQKGMSAGELEQRYNALKGRLEREKRELEGERSALQSEIDRLSQERDQLSVDKSTLETKQEELVQAKEKVEKEITRKEEKLATISVEKAAVEALAQERAQDVKLLSRDTLEKRFLLEEARVELMAQQFAVSQRNNLLRLGGVALISVLLLALLSYGRYRAKRRTANILGEKNKIIEAEQKRSEELLLNILPQSIAEELKANGKAKAQHFPEATVFFSDFVNFTAIAELLSPDELVEELDKCFKAFDFIIGQYPGLEKIKTIGDAYMCATGLSARTSLPHNLIRAALDMQEYLAEYKELRQRQGKPYFEARMGIHTGPVIAGVVGVKKFAYDIWGDTVNLAARMESHGAPGRINISQSTYDKVRYQFACSPRGKITAKNIGDIDMYFVEKELATAGV
ncbi:MAG: hypothetical protein H6555_02460 [Lewinellaceae bacterium]|nr:hypothetical protein [Lewinellaceae bacterium]